MRSPPPEFSRPVKVEHLAARGTTLRFAADAAERRALADRFGLLSLESLTAEVHLRPIPNSRMVRLRGTLAAEVVQSCVVTLEPVPGRVEESFDLVYAPDSAADAGEVDLSMDEADPPEPLVDGQIDVGEAVAEHLALGLEPFPRAAGARLDPSLLGDEETGAETPHPFAALASLRAKKSD